VNKRRRPAARRFRVVARPKTRSRRARLAAAVVALGLLGAVAVASARHAAGALARVARALPGGSGKPGAVVIETSSDAFRPLAQAAADAVSGTPGDKAAAIKDRFPCVKDVAVRRAWGEGRATLIPVLRSAVAPALRRGRPAGWLAADGTVFSAPRGVYALSGPTVDADGAAAADLAALAREWPALTAPGALPAPLAEMRWRAGDRGWEARLTDGTVVEWGALKWTKEKLKRLAEAMADARARGPGLFSADLRYFEDGKVLLRPAGRGAAVASAGGMER
jgi:hypothetical protein